MELNTTKRPHLESRSRRKLDEINNNPGFTDDLTEIVQETVDLQPGDRVLTGHALVVIRLHSHEPEKAQSIMFRLGALARFLSEEGAPGSTLPSGDGWFLNARAGLCYCGTGTH